jgi:hypothetical protein
LHGALDIRPEVPPAGHLACLVDLRQWSASVIGRKDHQHVTRANLAIDCLEQLVQQTIGLDRNVVCLRRIRAVIMAHEIVGGEAHRKQIGTLVFAELLRLQRAFGKLLHQLIAERRRLQ